MITKTIKLISKDGVPAKTKSMIKDIYAMSVNPNQGMLDTIPDYKFSQGDVLYFVDLRFKDPYIEEMEVECFE